MSVVCARFVHIVLLKLHSIQQCCVVINVDNALKLCVLLLFHMFLQWVIITLDSCVLCLLRLVLF